MENKFKYKRGKKKFSTYIIRIEMRKGPRPDRPIFYHAKEAGEKIDIIEKYEQLINNGVEVAYFVEMKGKNFVELVREISGIIDLIYQNYRRLKLVFKSKFIKKNGQ